MSKQVWALAVGCLMMTGVTGAQTPASSNAAAQAAPSAPAVSGPRQSIAPSAPSSAGPVQFPAIDEKNFTAPTPTRTTVDQFLRSVWGYDENREWRVASIKPSTEPGFVRVDVFVGDKRQPTRLGNYVFLVTPDGKHAVSGDLSPFGAQPFAEARRTLQQRADGPARGAVGKDLELVEFADLQCPACRAAQSTMDQLVKDFPQARVVYQDVPQTGQHPYAMQAAEVGHCVRQAKGDPAFFAYAQKVYDTEADLTSAKADATLRAAVTAAGADPASVMTCASQSASRAAVEASIKLAEDLGVTGIPTLMVNGRPLPLGQVAYAGLKRVLVYQGQMDGITVQEQPSLSTLK